MTTITVYTPDGSMISGFKAEGDAGGRRIRGYDLVCCAVSEKPVGVDCEACREVSLRAAERVCTEGELGYLRAGKAPSARFLTLWTLKESISKLRGVGLRESFKQYEITFEDGNPVCKGYTLHTQRIGGFFVSAAE